MTITVQVQEPQEVAVVEEFVCLDSLIHSTSQSSTDILRHNTVTQAAMQNLNNQIWKTRISIFTKLKPCNTCILPIFLYSFECWAVTKRDALKIDALDQQCLCKLLGIKWYQRVWNDDVRRTTEQRPLSAIVQARHLSLFKTDAKKNLTASPWRTEGNHQDVLAPRG